MKTIADFTDATAGGRIFALTFIKRTTGEHREMNCRREVAKHLKGGTLAFDPAAKNLMTVYDLQAKGYRMIPLDGLVSVRLAGRTYDWTGEAFVCRAAVAEVLT